MKNNKFKRRRDLHLPFVPEKKLLGRMNRELIADANYIYSTKRDVTDEDMRIIAGFDSGNPTSRNIYDWMHYHRDRIQVVDNGTTRYDERLDPSTKEYYESARTDTKHGLAVLGFFIKYSEYEKKLHMQYNRPKKMNEKLYGDLDIRRISERSETSKLLTALSTASEFVPLVIAKKDTNVFLNFTTNGNPKPSPGKNILMNAFVMQQLLKHDFFARNFEIRPDNAYYVMSDHETVWLTPDEPDYEHKED